MTDAKTLQLDDGRTLGYALLGDPAGTPAFFFHGTPGSRLVLSADDGIASIPGVRWILPDRPGYGVSSPQPGRTLLDWPRDVASLADHLGLERFAVAGVSGGGPHAAACAFALGPRVTATLLLASPAPASFRGATRGMALGNWIGIWLGRYAPAVSRKLLASSAAAVGRDPEGYLNALAGQMAAPDRALLQKLEVREAVLRDVREGYRQGSEAQASDGVLVLSAKDWGFELGAIETRTFAWHGEDDILVTEAMARHLERKIPGCRLRILPNVGHFVTESTEVIEDCRRILAG
ncbi:MAG: alpha/beta hydrolase [Acidobacteriota bacterium]